MKRLLSLVPWMATTAAWGQIDSKVSVVYGFYEPSSREAMRDGDTCWVPFEALKAWGFRVSPQDGKAAIQAEGRTLIVPSRSIGNKEFVQFNEAARQLGAHMWWDESGMFRVAGMVRALDFDGSHIRVDGTLGFKVNAFLLDSPRRLVIDLIGLALAEGQSFSTPPRVRVAQNLENVLRIVIEDPRLTIPRTLRPSSARYLDLNIGPYNFEMEKVTEPPFNTEPFTPNSNGGTPPVAPVKPMILRDVGIEKRNSTEEVVSFSFAEPVRKMPSVSYFDPTTVIVDFKGTTTDTGTIVETSGSLVESIKLEHLATGGIRAILSTKQPLVFRTTSDGKRTSVSLSKPKNADGKMRGKRIAIDAGHGGKDSGATWGSVYEKNLTLPIAKLTAQELLDVGASVIMTRDDDTYIGVKERGYLANDANADLLISIHINSNTVANKQSGCIAFHHMQDPADKLLAKCIFDEMAKVNDLPDIGIWSDSRIYSTGFGVLRVSDMPGTLLELGFITHNTDRAMMVQPAWQKKIAGAIARGIRRYFGDGE